MKKERKLKRNGVEKKRRGKRRDKGNATRIGRRKKRGNEQEVRNGRRIGGKRKRGI